MIRVLICESPDPFTKSRSTFPYGWWVGAGKHYGEIYKVERDQDMHHLPWIRHKGNWQKMDLTRGQADALQFIPLLQSNPPYSLSEKDIKKFCRDTGFPGIVTLLDIRADFEDYSDDELESYVTETEKLMSKSWIRVLCDGGNIYFRVFSRTSRDAYEAMMNFLMQIPRGFIKINNIFVIDRLDHVIWNNVGFDEAFETDKF